MEIVIEIIQNFVDEIKNFFPWSKGKFDLVNENAIFRRTYHHNYYIAMYGITQTGSSKLNIVEGDLDLSDG